MAHLESVDNALLLVLLLAKGDRITVTEAAKELGVSPSTAHRLLGTLVYRQFAQQAGDRSYGMGPALLGLRGSQRSRTRLLDIGRPHLQQLTAVTNETSHLAILVHRQVRFLMSVESQQMLRIGVRAGQVMPAHITAAGKALLADLPQAELDELYPADGIAEMDLDAAGVAAMHRELATVRRRGHAINRGTSERGLCAVALPIRAGEDNRAIASVTLSVPSIRFRPAQVAEFIGAVHETVSALAAELSA